MITDAQQSSTKPAARRKYRLAVIGSGPAGLMAAFVASSSSANNIDVVVFDKKLGPGRKLLIAGASGLNITHDTATPEFHKHYQHRGPKDFFQSVFAAFSPQDWLIFIRDELGLETFKGTSHRYFLKGMKASPLLRAWMKKLQSRAVTFAYKKECCDFERHLGHIDLHFSDGTAESFDAVCFALGGGSYETAEKPLRFPRIFSNKGLSFTPFEAANVGYELVWPKDFLSEAEGLPLKNIALTTSRGTRRGDLVVTRYGLEGTPIYSVGEVGKVWLDLQPDLSVDEILKKLSKSKENLAPIRRIKKFLHLSPAAIALFYHLGGKGLSSLEAAAQLLKQFPLVLLAKRPIDEAISSAGGLALENIDSSFMLKAFPGVFVAGEMLDWDAPTGGFLIQACVSQGYVAGKSILAYFSAASTSTPGVSK